MTFLKILTKFKPEASYHRGQRCAIILT